LTFEKHHPSCLAFFMIVKVERLMMTRRLFRYIVIICKCRKKKPYLQAIQ